MSQDRYVDTYISIVIGEAEKLYDKMVKDLVTVMMEEATNLKSDIPQKILCPSRPPSLANQLATSYEALVTFEKLDWLLHIFQSSKS